MGAARRRDAGLPEDAACKAGCPRCGREAASVEDKTDLAGWRLTAAAAGVFLVPLLPAVAGAVVIPRLWCHPAAQIAGGAGGLLIGAVAAAAAARLRRPAARRA